MSIADKSQKQGFRPEQLKHPERLLQLNIRCRGCNQLVDRTEIIDYLNGVSNPDLEPIIVYHETEVYHNEACENYALFGCDLEDVQRCNSHVDFDAVERIYGSDKRSWIKELDRRIRNLP